MLRCIYKYSLSLHCYARYRHVLLNPLQSFKEIAPILSNPHPYFKSFLSNRAQRDHTFANHLLPALTCLEQLQFTF